MYPLFKFTLNNDTKGPLVVDDPQGWDEIELILERDKDFHSVVEGVEVPLIFHGPAREYILDVLFNQGADSIVNITIELSTDEGATYTIIFEGVQSLESAEEIYEGTKSKSIQVPIMQNEFWQKFKNRFDTPVKIGDTVDLDGNTREVISSYTLNLPAQKLRKAIYAESNEDDRFWDLFEEWVGDRTNLDQDYSAVSVGFSNRHTVELDDLFRLGFGKFTSNTESEVDAYYTDNNLYFFKSKERGSLQIDLTIAYSFNAQVSSDDGTATVDDDITVAYILKHKNKLDGSITEYELTGTYTENIFDDSFATDVEKTWQASHSLSQIIDIQVGDELYLYGKVTILNYALRLMVDIDYTQNGGSSLAMYVDTEADDSTTEAFKIHETFHSACNLITGQNGSFYSEFLGNTSTSLINYIADGDGSYNALMGGINVRGKTLTEKPLFTSVKTLWNGANPIYNLGLGYELDGSGNDIIRVEVKEHFYQSNPHTTLPNINKLVRKIDDTRYIKAVQIGYKKWKSEEIGGLDDPQTKHDYATRFKTFGEDEKILSDFYAASLGIEATRRKSLKETEDWKLDDEIMIVALNRGGGSPSGLDYPELSEDFATTNLLNEETRYNVRLSPARMLLRWGNILSAGLTKYISAIFRFVGGEGNYNMRTQSLSPDRGDYDNGGILDENEDIAWDYNSTGDLKDEQRPIFVPVEYEFEYPISFTQYQSFKTNRKRSFYISETSDNLKEVFLLRLEYSPARGTGKFTCLKAYDPPATPSSVTATLNTSTEQYTVNWTDNSGNETGFIIEVNHNSTGFTEIGTVDADITSFLDQTTYTEGDTIQYRVRGWNDDGFGMGSTSGVYTVAYAPDQPSSVNASLNSDTGKYTITWVDESDNEDGFDIERSVDSGAFSAVGSTLANDADIVDPRAFSIGEKVIYRVKATNTVGDSAYRSSPEYTVPTINAPSGAASTFDTSTGQYTLTWMDNSGNEQYFEVQVDVDNTGYVTRDATIAANSTGYIDPVAYEDGQTVQHRVRATNATGESIWDEIIEKTVPATVPLEPSGFSSTYNSSTTNVDLAWTDNSSHEDNFVIYRQVNGGVEEVLDAAIPANTVSYTDTNTYNDDDLVAYRLYAENTQGKSPDVFTSETIPVRVPSAPSGATLVIESDTPELSWTDNSTNEDGFHVYLSVNGGAYNHRGTTTGTTFSDTGTVTWSGGDTLQYRIDAYNSAGSSSATSNVVTVLAAPTGATATDNTSYITIAWTDNSIGETGFKITRSVNGAAFADFASVGYDVTTYDDTSIVGGNSYTYRIKAYNADGETGYSETNTISL